MSDEFNQEEAKKFLLNREQREKEEQEKERQEILKKAVAIIQRELQNAHLEVYLVGSILRPYSFSANSDIDIVIKNFKGDRFDLWTKLEKEIGRKVEIILFETCSFQEFVLKEGLKVF